jgi:hypothetical protein
MFPLGLPHFEPIPDTPYYVCVRDFAYVDEAGTTHFIPNGFVTDGASIPGLFWLTVGHPFDPAFICAAVIHDKKWREAKTWADRTRANQLFREILRRQKVANCWERFSLAAGVWCGKLGNALAFWR